ncbi:MAG: lamin tail domain-containing protein [Acidobacteria bacterium]|nr:lamin tail domain-containing protein [Acidobacteriota bacterium]
MATSPHSGRRLAPARRQTFAVLTAAFLLLQQAIIFAPSASAQVKRATKLDAPSATKAEKAPAKPGVGKLPAPSLDDTVSPLAPSMTVVISQVYGGGGATTGSPTYKNDYVELFNLSASTVVLTGYSLQYGAATGNFGSVSTNIYSFPAGTSIPAGKYLFVQLSSAGTVGGNFPVSPDLTTTNLTMSAASGKVALANTTTALGCGATATPCTLPDARIVDLVSYGASNNGEGGTTVNNGTALTNTQGAVRKSNGCTDTDNNNSDFDVVTNPVPRNSTSPTNSCSAAPAITLSINDVSQDEGNAGTTAFTFTVSLSAASASNVTFNWGTADGSATAPSDYTAVAGGSGTITAGNISTTVTVNVNGDTTAELNETFFVNITNVVGATVTDGQGQGTIVNDDFTIVPIYQIQGSTPTNGSDFNSPYNGQSVATTGIVTLLKTGQNTGATSTANGFFLQDPTGDGNTDTSDGIFVFTSTVPTVAVGDSVRVAGTVQEFNGLTEIGSVSNVTVLSTGNSLPADIEFTPSDLDPTAPPWQPQLEKYEGMRVCSATGGYVTVAPNDNFYDVYAVLVGVDRPLREPGIQITTAVPPDPGEATPDPNVPRWDRNPERLKIDTNGRAGAANMPYTSNVTMSVTGPLDFAFGEYRLVAEQDPSASPNMTAVAAPAPEADEFTVASYNIENFNNNATQRQKAALTIREQLHLPDILGTVEIFDLADLQALRDQINNDEVAASNPNPQYEAYLVEQDGTSEDNDQDVGFLVKTSRVQVNSVTQRLATETYNVPGGGTALLHDRPPLVLDATVDPSGPAPQHVIVVVNHLRSFICIEADVDPTVAAGCAGGAADGPRVREKRRKQAESIAGLLQELQTNNPGVPVMSVGDYNAFQFSDGFTDPIKTIKGLATVDNELAVDASPDLVNPDFTDVVDLLPAADRYSFVFEGTPQALDHHIINGAARRRYTRAAIARVNSDFPEAPAATYVNNASTPERNSDHDPVVSYYRLGAAPALGSFIISEFRFRGPGAGIVEGAPVPGGEETGGPREPTSQDGDEFIEFYNNTDQDVTVSTLDNSSGWALVASDGATRFIIPNGTVIPARAHFLAAGPSYSLSSYGQGDPVLLPGDMGFINSFYSDEIPDGSGIAVFSSADPSNFNLDNRLDAAGYATADALYREGVGFPPPVDEATADIEYSFVRRVCVTPGAGCGAGLPKDTSENVNDFIAVSTNAAPTALGSKLGAPGPEGLTSPVNGNATMAGSLLDPSVSASQAPNRVRDFTSNPSQHSPMGTLSIRRTITNHTGAPVFYLAFRIIDMTTFPVPTGTADLRAIDSDDIQVTINGSPVDVRGTYVEQPPNQTNGGGLNSSMGVGYVNLGENALEDGESINVQFLLGIVQTGGYRFYVNIEMLTDTPFPPDAPAAPLNAPAAHKMKKFQREQRTRERGRRVNR